MLITNNNHDGKRWQIAFFLLYPPPPCLPLDAFCAGTVPGASSLQFVVVLPLSP